jgi:hypothetical protein
MMANKINSELNPHFIYKFRNNKKKHFHSNGVIFFEINESC